MYYIVFNVTAPNKQLLLFELSCKSVHKLIKILCLPWDLNARPYEIILLKIKHIRPKENYGGGEIPYQAKTGTGPMLLTC